MHRSHGQRRSRSAMAGRCRPGATRHGASLSEVFRQMGQRCPGRSVASPGTQGIQRPSAGIKINGNRSEAARPSHCRSMKGNGVIVIQLQDL